MIVLDTSTFAKQVYDDTDNTNTDVKFLYVVYDKVCNSDSDPIIALTRGHAVRSFQGFLATIPSHVKKSDFRLDLIGVISKGTPLACVRSEIYSEKEDTK